MAQPTRYDHTQDTHSVDAERFMDDVYIHAFDCDDDAFYEWQARWNRLSFEAKRQLLSFRHQGLSPKEAASMVA
jgi:hypothetical protein